MPEHWQGAERAALTQTPYGLATWLASMDAPNSFWRSRATLQGIIDEAKRVLASYRPTDAEWKQAEQKLPEVEAERDQAHSQIAEALYWLEGGDEEAATAALSRQGKRTPAQQAADRKGATQ